MKRAAIIITLIALTSCSSTRFVDSWKNKEITAFAPQKLLVVGMTDNLTARKIFEEELKNAFTEHGINAEESTMVFDVTFTDSKRSESEIDAMTDKLVTDGFDAVAITAIIGVDDKREYSYGSYYPVGYSWHRFGRYYFRFQEVYYMPDYYDDYKVYHIETSIYNIKEDKEKSLVWVGSFDLVNPQGITTTVKEYVARIVTQLERENLVSKLK